MKRSSIISSRGLAASLAASLAVSLVAPGPALAGAFDVGPCAPLARANFNAKSYRADMLMNFRGKPNSSFVEIERPDRVHVVNRAMEIISIGKKTWIKENGGSWKLSPMGGFGDLASIDPSKDFKPQGTGSCVAAGAGLWKGRPASIFKATATTARGVVHNTMYQLGDGYVHHMDATSPAGTSTFDFSKFNAVNITPPI